MAVTSLVEVYQRCRRYWCIIRVRQEVALKRRYTCNSYIHVWYLKKLDVIIPVVKDTCHSLLLSTLCFTKWSRSTLDTQACCRG
jgi:hypothetical protein